MKLVIAFPHLHICSLPDCAEDKSKSNCSSCQKLVAKKTDCFLILFFWQPLQQPLHTLKDSFCWWCWQLEPFIFHDENMPFISRCTSALQGHETWHWLSELLQHSLLMYVYQYSFSSLHTCAFNHLPIVSLSFSLISLLVAVFGLRLGVLSQVLSQCRWLLVQSNTNQACNQDF